MLKHWINKLKTWINGAEYDNLVMRLVNQRVRQIHTTRYYNLSIDDKTVYVLICTYRYKVWQWLKNLNRSELDKLWNYKKHIVNYLEKIEKNLGLNKYPTGYYGIKPETIRQSPGGIAIFIMRERKSLNSLRETLVMLNKLLLRNKEKCPKTKYYVEDKVLWNELNNSVYIPFAVYLNLHSYVLISKYNNYFFYLRSDYGKQYYGKFNCIYSDIFKECFRRYELGEEKEKLHKVYDKDSEIEKNLKLLTQQDLVKLFENIENPFLLILLTYQIVYNQDLAVTRKNDYVKLDQMNYNVIELIRTVLTSYHNFYVREIASYNTSQEAIENIGKELYVFLNTLYTNVHDYLTLLMRYLNELEKDDNLESFKIINAKKHKNRI